MMTLIFGGIYYFGLWAAGLRLLYVAVEYPFVYYREKRERLEEEEYRRDLVFFRKTKAEILELCELIEKNRELEK